MFLLLNKSLLTNLILPCGSGSGESEVTESCLTLRDPMDCSLTASSVHGIFQARVLEWGASAFSVSGKFILGLKMLELQYCQPHYWATSLSLFTFMHWRRKWQPTPVLLPGESQGRRSLVGCCLWGRTESDTTEAT